MSPFWSRKRDSSAADRRRRELAERERRRYERDREAEAAGVEVEPEAEPAAERKSAEPERRPLLPKTAQRTSRAEPSPPPKRRLRRRRRSKRGARARAERARPDLSGLRSASRSGARATRSGAEATVRQASPGVRRLLGAVGALLGALLAWVLRLAGLVERVVLAVIDTALGAGERLVSFGERELTPQRVLVFVIAVCGGLLIYSQFVAYRGVEVGQPDYTSVSTIAPAPQTDRVDAGAAHAYVLIPVAVLAVGIALAALATGRWKLGRLVALLGLAGIAVSLAIDLPKGLHEGTAGAAFAGAHATLTEGFYAEVFASAALVLCGLTLAAQLRASTEAPAKRRKRSRSLPGPSLRGALGRLPRPRRRRSSPAGGGA